ncbi:unnamed protein product, partial [Prorocentrum cordatum]
FSNLLRMRTHDQSAPLGPEQMRSQDLEKCLAWFALSGPPGGAPRHSGWTLLGVLTRTRSGGLVSLVWPRQPDHLKGNQPSKCRSDLPCGDGFPIILEALCLHTGSSTSKFDMFDPLSSLAGRRRRGGLRARESRKGRGARRRRNEEE